ncbi:MAG TPA: response regulator transcription factor [Thermoanaerobaculia bacterium]|nr:response regulator transcription factor [Thermoanaerobaculia bacterium]
MNIGEVTNHRIRLLIVDDHSVIRCGLRAIFGVHRDIEVVGEAADAESAARFVSRTHCDVALVDLRLAESSGMQVLRALHELRPSCRAVMLTNYATERDVKEAADAGAHGYVMKTADPGEIVNAVRAVHTGQRYFSSHAAALLADAKHAPSLTGREQQVLELLVPGNRNRTIAGMLGLAEETVKGHVKEILIKLGVRDRTGAATAAIRRGLVRID